MSAFLTQRRVLALGAVVLSCGAAASAGAQSRAARPEHDEAPRAARTARATEVTRPDPVDADPLASLGMSAAPSGGQRDSIGLLVGTVSPGGPADRAGVDAGSRLAEINGVSLRASGDAADGASSEAMMRRLARALGAGGPGGEMSLKLYRGGRFRTVTVTAPKLAGTTAAPAAAEPRLTLAPAPVASMPAVATATVGATRATRVDASAAGASSLAAVIDATVQTQAQLGRLVAQEEATDGPMLDSLAVIQQELRTLQRRLRALQARNTHGAPARAATAADAEANVALDGLKLGAVSDELVAYYGEGSDAGLLVLQSDAAWAPLHTGDVILRVNDAAATPALLRAAQTTGARIDVLRRRRTVTVTLPPGA